MYKQLKPTSGLDRGIDCPGEELRTTLVEHRSDDKAIVPNIAHFSLFISWI